MAPRTLVTGATGFLGSAVARRLLAAGHDLRLLVRPGADSRNIDGLPAERAKGDLRDEASLARALDGCTALFHVAADYRLWVPRPAEMYDVNLKGTERLMRAALSAGVARIVYTSSVATLGRAPGGAPADEETPSSLREMIGHYKRSKFLAEALVRRLVRERGLPAVIVNPSAPVGPRDIKPTPTGRIVVDAACGRMPAYVDTGLNLVHVDDVAEGHLLAWEKGREGERYILGGENMTLLRILEEIAAIAGTPPPRVRLPHGLVLPVALLSEAWARVLGGREPRVTLSGARMARKPMFYAHDKAARELGFAPRPVRKALHDAIAWFRENGYCPAAGRAAAGAQGT